ncbi:MAG: hypothetical protein ACK6AY_13150 [Akkermansiaceae bacterium]
MSCRRLNFTDSVIRPMGRYKIDLSSSTPYHHTTIQKGHLRESITPYFANLVPAVTRIAKVAGKAPLV